jgi:hypothetical protein
MEEKLLHAGDVATILGISERSALRLMTTGAIESCRIGPGERLVRTVRPHVESYRQRQFDKARVTV